MIFWCYPVLLVHTLFYRSVSTAVGLSPYLVLLTVVEPCGVVAYDNFIAWATAFRNLLLFGSSRLV